MTVPTSPVSVPAPAKVNLTLHVVGRRTDGYHLLDSLVVFAACGDTVTAAPAPDLTLTITGPRGAGLSAAEDNLVLRAARLCARHVTGTGGAHLTLHKELPVASGIGGGSSDAAATLIACAHLWGAPLPAIRDTELAADLGADVPVCLRRAPTRMQGIGEILTDVPPLPDYALVLVNPGVPLATAPVFKALAGRGRGPMPPLPPRFADAAALAAYLRACSNDLMAPAQDLLPEIAAVVRALEAAPACLLARMSGSGPTCFGLFATLAQAEAAATALRAQHPSWWVAPTAPFVATAPGA